MKNCFGRTSGVILLIGVIGFVSASTWAKSSSHSKKVTSDRKAVKAVDEMVAAMAGENNWKDIPFLRFDYRFTREGVIDEQTKHLWDLRSGRYRVEWRTPKDIPVLAFFNVLTSTGKVFVGQEEVLVSPDRENLLKQAQGYFIKDTFWLFAPFRLKEKGVVLKTSNIKLPELADHALIVATFPPTIIPLGKDFHFYINRRDNYVSDSVFAIQESTSTDGDPHHWRWSQWNNIGHGIVVSQFRQRADRDWTVEFPLVRTQGVLDERFFEDQSTDIPMSDPEPE